MTKAKDVYEKKLSEDPDYEQPFLMQVLPDIKMPDDRHSAAYMQGKRYLSDKEIADKLLKWDKSWIKKYYWKSLHAWFGQMVD